MKKRFAGIMATAAIILILSACAPREENYGSDNVTYYNAKRDEVISQYMGQKAQSTASQIQSEIKVTYSEADGEESYQIFVENSNAEYFYNGTVTLTDGSSENHINIKMLPPSSSCQFAISLSGDITKFSYRAEGNFYGLSDAADAGVVYEECDIGKNTSQKMIVINADPIDDEAMDRLARHYYSMDTLYNYESAVSYYLVTKSDYDAGDKTKYDCEMTVDTKNQTVIFKDRNGNTLATKSY